MRSPARRVSSASSASYIAHVHDGTCDNAGGDHYRFDPNGPALPPNEIHLASVAGSDTSGFMTAEDDSVASEDAVTIVVHPQELLDNRIACARSPSTRPNRLLAGGRAHAATVVGWDIPVRWPILFFVA